MKRAREAEAAKVLSYLEPEESLAVARAQIADAIREQQLAFGRRIIRWLQQMGGPLQESNLERLADEEGT